MDLIDVLWMKRQPKSWNLTPVKFEQLMEWLENSSELQVPTIDALISQPFVKDLELNVIEEIYDHWLEKRLVGKQKLLCRVKKENKRKRTKALKDDPYVAFRQCPEKMHTRKNRAVDHENFIKMLKRKKDMQNYMKTAARLIQSETRKLQAFKLKLAMFEDQYRSGNFDEQMLTPSMNNESSCNVYSDEESDIEMREEVLIEVNVKEDFTFKPNQACKYFAVSCCGFRVFSVTL
jgi:enhancer of polycomb-like protein